MKKLLFYICISLSCIVVFPSCRVYKEQTGITYLKNADVEILHELVAPYKLKIKPDDDLQIVITSTIPQATSHFNLPAPNYNVSETGDIVIPNIGKLQVAGLTTDEAAELIYSKVIDSVKDPIVKVDIRNFNVVVLGEVRNPGTKVFAGQRCSVFDAIGAAGDITLTGRRDNILLMRENDRQVQTVRLDLSDKSIVESPYFYLQQNDVLIVEATDIQKENSTYNTMNSFKLQTISTIVSVVSVLASLGIALLLK